MPPARSQDPKGLTEKAVLMKLLATGLLLLALTAPAGVAGADVWDDVERGYADSNGVKIHYATLGEGPLIVMIHGFPDFWYTTW